METLTDKKCIEYRDNGLCLDFYENFLNKEEADKIKQYFDTSIKWRQNETRESRINQIFADNGLKYTISYMGKTFTRDTVQWDPVIKSIKNNLENFIDEKFTVCVLQKYKHGNIGIKPHRDKEMKKGTIICGLSVGETRTLTVARGNKKYELKLTHGSLYVFNHPTNDYWSHSIEKDSTKNVRYSATFRNY